MVLMRTTYRGEYDGALGKGPEVAVASERRVIEDLIAVADWMGCVGAACDRVDLCSQAKAEVERRS
ncbi:MAG: hypothetical protein IT432_17035 [Phycisphaerales bacterium]|nr:hypothetical protein [Phycisphaerales bacterium]